jgi:hypothetical protein
MTDFSSVPTKTAQIEPHSEGVLSYRNRAGSWH